MKKLFTGLLVIAVAGGAFFLLKKKKEKPVANALNKEWIIGKWKTASSQPAIDSVQPELQYEFRKEGVAYRYISDSGKADTLSYAWKDAAQLVIRANPADSAGTVLTVSKLTPDSLRVQGGDSVVILLTKVK